MPEPEPEPEPGPELEPEPEPGPEPEPEPEPGPEPGLEPEPGPGPGLEPEPQPEPEPSSSWRDHVPERLEVAWSAEPLATTAAELQRRRAIRRARLQDRHAFLAARRHRDQLEAAERSILLAWEGSSARLVQVPLREAEEALCGCGGPGGGSSAMGPDGAPPPPVRTALPPARLLGACDSVDSAAPEGP